MFSYLARRLALSVLVLWGAVTIVFLAIRLAPGDPAQMLLGANATEQDAFARLSRDDHDARCSNRPAPRRQRAHTRRAAEL